MIVYYLLSALYVIVCIVLLLVILMQQGRGDMASAFGGGGSSQTAFGARAGATVLTRATTVLGALFMIGAIIIGLYGQRGPGSVLSGVKGPAQPASTQQPAPAQPKKYAGSSDLACGSLDPRFSPPERKWRNWQTHQLEGLAVAIPWGFESPLPHHDR